MGFIVVGMDHFLFLCFYLKKRFPCEISSKIWETWKISPISCGSNYLITSNQNLTLFLTFILWYIVFVLFLFGKINLLTYLNIRAFSPSTQIYWQEKTLYLHVFLTVFCKWTDAKKFISLRPMRVKLFKNWPNKTCGRYFKDCLP